MQVAEKLPDFPMRVNFGGGERAGRNARNFSFNEAGFRSSEMQERTIRFLHLARYPIPISNNTVVNVLTARCFVTIPSRF